MDIEFRKSSVKQLSRYKKKDPLAYKIITAKIKEIQKDPYKSQYQKVRKYDDYKRARKGNFRICFKIENNIIYIPTVT